MLRQLLASAQLIGLLTENLGDWVNTKRIGRGVDVKIQELMTQRLMLRQIKQWEQADEIRDGLKAAGVLVSEHKDGSYSIDYAPDFDPTKLEALQ